MEFGRRIREQRKERGWTLTELAEKGGISAGFLSDLENAKQRNIGVVALLEISRVLGVSLDYLMTGAGSKKGKKSAPVDIEVPPSLASFAAEAGLSFRQTLVLLELQRVILAHRKGGRRSSLKGVDWRKFFKAIRGFL